MGDDFDPRVLALSAIELLTKGLVAVLLAPLVFIGYWRKRYQNQWDRAWCRADIGTAGFHLLACLAWVVVLHLLSLEGCA